MEMAGLGRSTICKYLPGKRFPKP
ncbi:TPA: transcriptional regulator, partial [Pseudomonas aeruginosa]|nr:transcriptional regulator [Pseudomonas aeruginosa]HBO3615502.1 transcriptional regulator [Pseudomonas aeruginosa]